MNIWARGDPSRERAQKCNMQICRSFDFIPYGVGALKIANQISKGG
jgi:hypothetical protein